MKNKIKFTFSIILLLLSATGLAGQLSSHKYHPKLKKAEQYILTNKPDSALMYLNQITDSTFNTYISFLKKDIIQPNVTYEHLHSFLLTVNNRKEIHAKYFLDYKPFKHIQTPRSTSKPDGDYIYLVGDYLNTLADRGYITNTQIIYDKYNAYIKQFDQNNELVQIAKFKMNTYNGLMAYINNDINTAQMFYQHNIEIGKLLAKNENYTPLIEAYSSYTSVLMAKGDLDEYINVCKKIIELYKIQIKKGVTYSINTRIINDLINALIHQSYKAKNNNNLEDIKALIKLGQHQPNRDYNFNTVYINVFKILDEHSLYARDIFKQFNVKNLPELCTHIGQDIETNKHKLDVLKYVKIATMVLDTKGYYEEALKHCRRAIKLSKKIYTEDLANQIAEHKSLEEQNKRKHTQALLKAKTQRDNYIFIALAVIILSIVIISRIQYQKNKILKVKNEEKQFFIEEINHRIKNNFQIASAYLRIQFSAFKNKDIDLLIKQWNSKIKSIIAVHQYLYQNDTLKINVKQYADGVIQEVLNIYPEIKYTLHINIPSELELYNNTAIKIGLIMNELLTNAVKHGVSENNALTIRLTYTERSQKGHYKITYTDSGIKAGFDLEQVMENSFGYRLIENLCSHINGALEFSKNDQSLNIIFKDQMQYN